MQALTLPRSHVFCRRTTGECGKGREGGRGGEGRREGRREGGREGEGWLRCEHLLSFSVLLSMAPLSQEVQSIGTCLPPHLGNKLTSATLRLSSVGPSHCWPLPSGPPTAEMNSIWFKLWLYHKLSSGPPSLLLGKGYRLRRLPTFLKVPPNQA